MRRGHFDALRPVCPLCRAPLTIGTVVRECGADVLEGIVVCTNHACLREYPVIDGIPIFIAAIRAWIASNPLQVLQRGDLSPELESLLGDAQGPASAFDVVRQHVSTYAADYEAEVQPLVARALAMLGEAPPGPAIDLGCAAGRGTLELAARTERLTLGVDLNFAMLRVASAVLREGRVRYPRRRAGLVYDRRDFAVGVAAPERIDFWCCDAAALPLPDATFAAATALNLVDCVAAPRELLAEAARVVAPGGAAVFATPYDWSPGATPVEQWLGGHSQRSADAGASEPVLRTALAASGFEIVAEEEVTWRVRLHERSSVEYAVHLAAALRESSFN